jgi:hypothetical protein
MGQSEQARRFKTAVRQCAAREFQFAKMSDGIKKRKPTAPSDDRSGKRHSHLNPQHVEVLRTANDFAASTSGPSSIESFSALNNRSHGTPAPCGSDSDGLMFLMNQPVNPMPFLGDNDPDGLMFLMNQPVNPLPFLGDNDPDGLMFLMNQPLNAMPFPGSNNPNGAVFVMNTHDQNPAPNYNNLDTTLCLMNDHVDKTQALGGNNFSGTHAHTCVRVPSFYNNPDDRTLDSAD